VSTDIILRELQCLGLSINDCSAEDYDTVADMVAVNLLQDLSPTPGGCQLGPTGRRSGQVANFGSTSCMTPISGSSKNLTILKEKLKIFLKHFPVMAMQTE
jgi:hypothetical protein